MIYLAILNDVETKKLYFVGFPSSSPHPQYSYT